MLKKVLVIAVLLSIVGLVGCTSSDTSSAEKPATVTVVRDAVVGSIWKVKQMEINLVNETLMVLYLAPGDKVDGYFYTIIGDNITFSITANSLISLSAQGQSVGSDRFSFTATQALGIAYILKLKPIKKSDEEKEETL